MTADTATPPRGEEVTDATLQRVMVSPPLPAVVVTATSDDELLLSPLSSPLSFSVAPVDTVAPVVVAVQVLLVSVPRSSLPDVLLLRAEDSPAAAAPVSRPGELAVILRGCYFTTNYYYYTQLTTVLLYSLLNN